MVLDLFTFKNPEKNSEEVGEEEIQPDMIKCPKIVYIDVTDSILDFAGNASSTSTSGQLSETTFTGENHQITGYLFSDLDFASKRLKQISTGPK